MDFFIQTGFGYCFYDLSKNKALIYGLYVKPKFRRKGHAKAILGYVINEIRRLGYNKKILIEVKPREESISIEKLCSFYEKMGLVVLS